MRRRRRFSATEKKAYARSNKATSVAFDVTPEMRDKARDLEQGLLAEDEPRVHQTVQSILDLLCGAAAIPPVTLKLKEAASARFRGGKAVWKLYGLYEPDGTITIAFKTAVRKQVFAYRTFLNTVVHEFMHHYDARRLRLAASFHTSGFYRRIRGVIDILMDECVPAETTCPS